MKQAAKRSLSPQGNTFGGTAFASYGCFWCGWWMIQLLVANSMYKGSASFAVGETLWFILWAVLTAGFFVVTLRKNMCLATVFSTLTITFILLAGGVWEHKCKVAAGYIGGCAYAQLREATRSTR